MPPNQIMVLNLEQSIVHMATKPLVSGILYIIIDYTAMRLDLSDKGEATFLFTFSSPPSCPAELLHREKNFQPPTTENVRSIMPASFLIIEAKPSYGDSIKYILQAVGKMYTYTKSLRSASPFLLIFIYL